MSNIDKHLYHISFVRVNNTLKNQIQLVLIFDQFR